MLWSNVWLPAQSIIYHLSGRMTPIYVSTDKGVSICREFHQKEEKRLKNIFSKYAAILASWFSWMLNDEVGPYTAHGTTVAVG